MAFNPRGSFSIDLSLFGSLVTDILPTNLPPGGSPDNQDCFFLPGGVFTRPALAGMLPSPITKGLVYAGQKPVYPSILSVKDFPLPNGDYLTVFLDSNGSLWGNDAMDPTSTVPICSVSSGSRFKAENYGNKQFYAFFNLFLSAGFSYSRFTGSEVPLYYNGTDVWKVTPEAPGGGLSIGKTIIPSYLLDNNGSPPLSPPVPSLFRSGNIVTAYLYGTSQSSPTVLRAGWFVNIVDTSAMVGSIPDGTVPFAKNELFQGIGGGVGSSTFQGDGSGNVTVTMERPIPNMPVGAWLYYWTPIPPAGALVSYQSGLNDTLVWDMGTACPYSVGQQVLLTAYIGSVLTTPNIPQTITAVSGDTFSVPYAGPTQPLSNVNPGASVVPVGNLYGSGWLQVTEVLSTAQFKFLIVGNGCYGAAAGNVYDYFGSYTESEGSAAPGFQVLSVDTQTGTGPNSISWYQLGPDNVYAGSDALEAIPNAQAATGSRSAVCLFKTVDGAITAASPPVDFFSNGGSSYMSVQAPIGPPGTAQRIISFTPAGGSSYYYITPSVLPSVESTGAIISLGTIIPDNVTTSTIMDFSDAALTGATQIDIAGNDLFEQTCLAPCLGVMEYAGRLAWWGEANSIKNLLNMSLDGGYVPAITGEATIGPSGALALSSGEAWTAGDVESQIFLGVLQPSIFLYTITGYTSGSAITVSPAPASSLVGQTVPFTVYTLRGAQPPGWEQMGGSPGYLVYASSPCYGFSYQWAGTVQTGIQQPCYQDSWGGQILLPDRSYLVRMLAQTNNRNTVKALCAQVYSPSQGILSSGSVPVSSLSVGSLGWTVIAMEGPMPDAIPPDAVLQVLVSGSDAYTVVTIDEIEVIDALEPVLYDQARLSYYQNPFGYNSITGVLSVDPSEPLTGVFRQRGYLYLLSDRSLYQSQNNGTGEPSTWPVIQYSTECGCCGPNAVDSAEDVAHWAGRYGARTFFGDPAVRKVSQEISSRWEAIDWEYETTAWVKNDSVNRMLLFGLPIGPAPLGASMSPSKVLAMSYRLTDAAVNVSDPIHVSMYSGKLICTDMGRRWTVWNLAINCADMCMRPSAAGGLAREIIFGGSFGNLYSLDMYNYPPVNPDAASWNYIDQDYGSIDSYYTTYFFYDHMTEQQQLLGLYRKLYNYLALHATGVGSLLVTPLVDALSNPGLPLVQTLLQLADPGFDLEWHPLVRGNRVAWKIQPVPLPGRAGAAMAVTHMVVSGRKDMLFPVRGGVFSA